MFFSSTYHQHESSINPYLTTFPSSSTYPSLSAANTLPCFTHPPPHEVDDFVTNTFLHDPLVGLVPFIPSTTTSQTPHHHASFTEEAVANLAMLDNQQHACNNNDSSYGLLHYGSTNPNLLTQKPAAAIAKKDRHSKIHTSQGLRDRRVRLSSDIARKFFDLQEMLDFDKPSNTLEWLFTKSENAIKELARSKHNNNNNNNGLLDNNTSNEKPLSGSGGDSSNSSKGKKSKWTHRDQDICTTIQTKKESREKARARARERTCFNKMCNNSTWKLIEERTSCPAISSNTPQYEANCARWPHHQMLKPYPSDTHHPLGSDAPFTLSDGYNVIEDSIMIKRNNMKPSMMMSSSHNQQNLVIPKESRFNNNDDYQSFPYSTQNWDTNNGNSNFSGIATMNLSTFFMNQ
ncbi:PREDICTED: transcription factor CYCLOIDEA-like [Lupinus angustifolius]|uniref:transcription factor CYCLOIDEA-like n=1 Tax=Lupinus angustifolius TaxID=3871 RepID=UPI00092E3D15|nr:PREDICTED: transcription factor CYCLOIDEA-like [Lupinus angustifolius]